MRHVPGLMSQGYAIEIAYNPVRGADVGGPANVREVVSIASLTEQAGTGVILPMLAWSAGGVILIAIGGYRLRRSVGRRDMFPRAASFACPPSYPGYTVGPGHRGPPSILASE